VPTPPLGDERRAAIADAAIGLVAAKGLRGLTHRAVDAEAGLPPGSTSYYLRTRDALLTACVERMVQRDLAGGPLPATANLPDLPDLPDLLIMLVVGTASSRPDDLLARYELSLEAVRRPGLRAALVESGTRLREMLAGALAEYGVPDAAAAAWPVAAMLDGLMYDRVAGAGSSLGDEEFAGAVRRTVDGLLAGLRASAPR
jgi:DNA-binding transcriptional regulator YbjK